MKKVSPERISFCTEKFKPDNVDIPEELFIKIKTELIKALEENCEVSKFHLSPGIRIISVETENDLQEFQKKNGRLELKLVINYDCHRKHYHSSMITVKIFILKEGEYDYEEAVGDYSYSDPEKYSCSESETD